MHFYYLTQFLKPLAIMLQFVRPARASWGLLGDDWPTRMDESSRPKLRAAPDLRTFARVSAPEKLNFSTVRVACASDSCDESAERMEIVKIPIWQIQPAPCHSLKTVKRYIERLRNGEKAPPITLQPIYPPGFDTPPPIRLRVMDGAHRLRAAAAFGLRKIRAVLLPYDPIGCGHEL